MDWIPLNGRARGMLCVLDDAGHSARAPGRFHCIHMNPTKNDKLVSVVCKETARSFKQLHNGSAAP